MTACSHLLCVKHGASISSCPVCHADVPATHLSSLDFGHQLSSREVSLLRSIAIKAPREISQLLVEANSFVLKQANFQFGSLHDRKETESASLDQTNQALIQKNGALRQQLSEVSREAETSAVVLAELREDLRRVEQQQSRAGGFGSGNWNSSGTSSVGGVGSVGQSSAVSQRNSSALAPYISDHARRSVGGVGPIQQQQQQHQQRDREQQRAREQQQQRDRERLRERQQEVQRQQQQQQQQRQQQQQQQQQEQQQQEQQEQHTTTGRSSSYFTKPTSSTFGTANKPGYQTPSRGSSSFGSTKYTPSRRIVSSRPTSTFVQSRSAANTPNNGGYVRKSATPRLDFKNVSHRASARLQ